MQLFICYISTQCFLQHLQGQCVFRWCLIYENARNGNLQSFNLYGKFLWYRRTCISHIERIGPLYTTSGMEILSQNFRRWRYFLVKPNRLSMINKFRSVETPYPHNRDHKSSPALVHTTLALIRTFPAIYFLQIPIIQMQVRDFLVHFAQMFLCTPWKHT